MRSNQNKGLSLTELLVASILIGLVMLSVVSTNLAIKKVQDSTGFAAIVTMRATAALNQIASDARLATGDASSVGVVEPGGTSICFRQDTNDPTSYVDDIWVCYEHGGSRGINRCFGNTAGGYPTTSCTDATKTDLITITQNTFYSIVIDEATNTMYIELTITTRYDPSAPAHPIDNPETTMTTRVSPPMHSW